MPQGERLGIKLIQEILKPESEVLARMQNLEALKVVDSQNFDSTPLRKGGALELDMAFKGNIDKLLTKCILDPNNTFVLHHTGHVIPITLSLVNAGFDCAMILPNNGEGHIARNYEAVQTFGRAIAGAKKRVSTKKNGISLGLEAHNERVGFEDFLKNTELPSVAELKEQGISKFVYLNEGRYGRDLSVDFIKSSLYSYIKDLKENGIEIIMTGLGPEVTGIWSTPLIK